MRQLFKILLSVWIISGIASGTGYAYIRSSHSFRTLKEAHYSKSQEGLKAAHDNCYQTRLEQALECENEFEDDNEKTALEESRNQAQRFRFSSGQIQTALNRKSQRSRPLNILYCIYRI